MSDRRIRNLERRVQAGDLTAVPALVSLQVRSQTPVPIPTLFNFAQFISQQLDEGICDLDSWYLLIEASPQHIHEQLSLVIAQNPERRLFEQDCLYRLEHSDEEAIQEVREISSHAQSLWERGETIDPVTYWVYPQDVLGLPCFFTGDIDAHWADFESAKDLYESTPLKNSVWYKHPRGGARFITRDGVFLEFGSEIIQEEHLVHELACQLRLLDAQVARFFSLGVPRFFLGVPRYGNPQTRFLSRYGRLLALTITYTDAEIEHGIEQVNQLYAQIQMGGMPDRHAWNNELVARLRHLIFASQAPNATIYIPGSGILELSRMVRAGAGENEIKARLRKFFLSSHD